MIPEMEGLLFWEGNIFRWKDTFTKKSAEFNQYGMHSGGKRHKISPIIETHPEALSEKTERSKGLPS